MTKKFSQILKSLIPLDLMQVTSSQETLINDHEPLRPFSFLGFGSRPRMCPGMNLAKLEISVHFGFASFVECMPLSSALISDGHYDSHIIDQLPEESRSKKIGRFTGES
ncbi:hypothetical protein JHK85_043974 [Glycine max]|nr:hypothetical protein JHK85_043974 [Glycine max]